MSATRRTIHARAGETSLTFTRTFDAPVELVVRAHVDAELFCRWMGPRGTTCTIDRLDATTGGSFRYTVVGGSRSFTFFGSYHEVAPARIVHSWEFEGDRGRPTLEILDFVDIGDGRCRLDGMSLYTSAEQCTEMFELDQSGDGMDENFERLDELLTELR